MIVQNTSALSFAATSARRSLPRQASTTPAATTADAVHISREAREALAAASASSTGNDKSVEARLAEIRARGPVNRSQEDRDFLFANDKRLAEIVAQGKSADKLTAEELDYMQKATGFVNTMANLNPAEKALYDKAVAGGNADAAAGIAQIALIRMGTHTAGGANGEIYDPHSLEITVANIEKYFSYSIVDSSGVAASRFQALIQFLNSNPAA